MTTGSETVPGRWVEVTASEFPHEREGLSHVREYLPDAEPYHAWSNFTFLTLDGRPREVDLLVLTPSGFSLVELKGWSGTVRPDHGRWKIDDPALGRSKTVDDPFVLADKKAKELRSVLESQARRSRGQVHVPFVEAAVFLHGPGIRCKLDDHHKAHVFGREDVKGNGLRRIVTDCLTRAPRQRPIDAPHAKGLVRLLDELGLRRQVGTLKVAEWVLDETPYDTGWGWEDRLARHEQFERTRARVRRYFSPPGATPDQVAAIERGARREYLQFRGLDHPGLVVPQNFHALDDCVAVVYERDVGAEPLEVWLDQRVATLTLDERLDLIESIAGVLRYAHDHGLVHRGLSPRSVLVAEVDGRPRALVKDWQTVGDATSSGTASSTTSGLVGQVLDGDPLMGAYAAPEVLVGRVTDRRVADVFSLGAVAFRVLTGEPPASDADALRVRVRQDGGLDLSSVLDGIVDSLVIAVLCATDPVVARRTKSVDVFVEDLDRALGDMTAPEPSGSRDPLQATRGDVLEGGLTVGKVLGEGSTGIALRVTHDDGSTLVLKVAKDASKAERLVQEADVLRALGRADHVAALVDGPVEIANRTCLIVEHAGDTTLAEHLRREGPLGLDLLERWGDDLLAATAVLEHAGVRHRDVKPANLGIRTSAGDRKKRLVLFDFSLASAPLRDLTAGTPGYVDPFLGSDGRTQYDPAAELFAVSVTLHEMATGRLPVWGDGASDPSMVDDEVTLDLAAADEAVRTPLASFFARALARDVHQRFDNVEAMSAAWRAVFAEVEPEDDRETRDTLAAAATTQTPLAEAGLTPRAAAALARLGAVNVADVVALDPLALTRLQGAAIETKNEVVARAKQWRDQVAVVEPVDASRSIDALLARLLKDIDGDEPVAQAMHLLLGQRVDAVSTGPLEWPTPTAAANAVEAERKDVSAAWAALMAAPDTVVVAHAVRDDVVTLLSGLGNVATVDELADALLSRRGSHASGALRRCQALALVRLAVEAPAREDDAVLVQRRNGDVVLVAAGIDDSSASALVDSAFEVVTTGVVERLASSPVLPGSAVVIDRLREAAGRTPLDELHDARLVALLAAAAGRYAVSPRGEVYAVGMSARDALRRSKASLLGVTAGISEDMLRRRVRARFPHAAELPTRPDLDHVLREAGIELEWRGERYEPPTMVTVRPSTSAVTSHAGDLTAVPEKVDARLDTAVREASFLALAVSAKDHTAARAALLAKFGLTEVDATRTTLRRLHQMVRDGGADWAVVTRADAYPSGHVERARLDGVVAQAARAVGEQIALHGGPVLLTGLGLLARHGALGQVAQWAQESSGRGHALLALVPMTTTMGGRSVDGAALPVSHQGQWLLLPPSWTALASDHAV